MPPVAARTRQSVRRVETLRQRLSDAIEAAIDALDTLDGDPDLEPSLAAVEYMGRFYEARGCDRRIWVDRWGLDLEEACEDEGADAGDEG